MGEEERCVRTTRASKKRAFASLDKAPQSQQQLPPSKTRVVLGELTNTPDLGSTQTSNFGDTQKPILKLKRTTTKKIPDSAKSEIVEGSDVPQKCAFAPHMYQHLHSLEVEEKRRPWPNYMQIVQNDVTVAMREMLLDWLVEVAEEYRLVSDTLYLTVAYIDRFLSQHPLSRDKLQLLGVSCMLVASKYEEISPPHVEDFCYITDNTYAKEDVLNMEIDVLKLLNFEMGPPTTKTFLRIFTRVAHENCESFNLQFEFLSCYLAELSLLDYECLQFLPSMLAASAIFLSRFTVQPNKHPWSLVLQNYSGYMPSDLKDCVLAIHDLQLGKREMLSQAVKEKYMLHKFKCVATLSSPSIPASYFEAIKEHNHSRVFHGIQLQVRCDDPGDD